MNQRLGLLRTSEILTVETSLSLAHIVCDNLKENTELAHDGLRNRTHLCTVKCEVLFYSDTVYISQLANQMAQI